MKRSNVMAAGALLALVAGGVPATVRAGDTGEKVGGTVEESARTGGHAVRDGVLTFGRTVRDFFTGGSQAARETWHENANVRSEANR
jgi:hypothetical protein